MPDKQTLILIGGGGHCRACIDVIRAEGRYQIEGILDAALSGQELSGVPVTGTDADIAKHARNGAHFLITVGQIRTAEIRKRIFETIRQAGGQMATVISPLAYVSETASVGEGTIVLHQALVNAGATVGANCIINTKSLIEHDARVGDHCHIATAAVLNGGVTVGEETFVGSSSVLIQGIAIGAGSLIGAGSTVTRNLDAGMQFTNKQIRPIA